MNKRIVSLLIIITLAFTGLSVNANALNKGFDSVVDKFSEFSSEDRENLFTILYPMIIVDSGIDGLVSIIETYNGNNSGVFGPYVEELLKYSSKEDIVFFLNSLKVIPEKIRNKYLTVIKNREELKLSADSSKRFGSFMDKLYGEFPKIKDILAEDGISEGVVANFICFIPAANDNIALLKADSKYKFSLNRISPSILDRADALSEKSGRKIALEQIVKSFASFINNEISYENRENIYTVFAELGICKGEAVDENSSSNGSSTDSDNNAVTDNAANKIVFTDIDGWYKEYILALAEKGIVSGRGDGKFYPNDTVTREEFVKMICNAVNLPVNLTATSFVDVDVNAWYAPYISTAYYNGVINGQSAQIFGIGQNILRQDAAVICNNIIKGILTDESANITFADDTSISAYAKESVYNLAKVGIINGDNLGNFNPSANLTRGESAKIICELIKYMEKSR